ncbi:MAG TPA: hypothetical protein VMR81_02625 [Patescibacteria group bacterium]|nr:hypothetical protein [Patescibacteria group bacterium]
MENDKYKEQFAILSNNLDIFTKKIRKKKSTLMATDIWTVKDVLCHIVFWHESYAANYRALAENLEPPLLNGPGYKLNTDGVASLQKYSIPELIDRLGKAQNSLYVSIVEKGVPKMTYKKDGHIYTTPEFLDVIARHLATHTKHVRRAR